MTITWPRGAATGVGSMPGDDPAESCRVLAGELPDLPFLPELPSRGPGSDLLGRAASILVDLHVDLQPSGWRLTSRAGVDERRARDLLRRDLDALEVAFAGYAGPLKLQVCGPWTLCAGVELPRGDRALADPVARRDVSESLAEGLRVHVADVAARVPGATLIVQLDEPGLSAVRDGRIPTASGFGAIAAVPDADLSDGLRAAVDACGVPTGVHCCADDPALGVLAASGAVFLSVDSAKLVPRRDYDPIGESFERGVVLLLGVVPSLDVDLDRTSVADAAAPARALGRALGVPPADLADRVVVTPTCGLAGASPAYARAALHRLTEVGRSLAEAPEER
ncbi:MAG TPA: methionine synthase [Mycobacteriales bacterium]|nr:methionine synthase [Mycobacteriales bacterium]